MRIVHLAAGAGVMYCGACARDLALVRGLRARGHDVVVVPLYTPLRFDSPEPVPTAPVHLGGINAWLEQYVPFWRYLPRFIRRGLDHPAVLDWAARFAVSTKASDLGPMLVSVLRGTRGHQKRSIAEVVEFIEKAGRPDLVSITNSLLSGIAPELKQRFRVPVVCALQGEETFVQSAKEPYATTARELLQENAASVDLFLAPGEAYAQLMAEYLSVSRERIKVVRVGIDPTPYRRSGKTRPYPFTVGYLSVITPAKGVDILVEAVRQLVEQGKDLILVVAGRVLDRKYWTDTAAKIESHGLGNRVRFLDELDFASKTRFFHGCSAFCLPSRISETRGVVALEAQAAGLPVVVPDRGVFPEMLELTGGGLLFRSEDADDLARQLRTLMEDPGLAERLGDAGAAGVARHFNAETMVAETEAVFSSLISGVATDTVQKDRTAALQ